MKTIYKYPIPLQETTKVDWPKGGQLLDIQVQNGEMYAWVLVDPDEQEMVTKNIVFYGTGHGVPDYHCRKERYIKTVQVGQFVGHLFWRFGSDVIQNAS